MRSAVPPYVTGLFLGQMLLRRSYNPSPGRHCLGLCPVPTSLTGLSRDSPIAESFRVVPSSPGGLTQSCPGGFVLCHGVGPEFTVTDRRVSGTRRLAVPRAQDCLALTAFRAIASVAGESYRLGIPACSTVP